MERFTTEEDCKRLGLRPVEPSPYPVHMPIPAPQQLGKLGLGWVRVVCHACKLQYDVDQIEHYRHPSVLHVAEFVCPQGHIATSRRVFTSLDDQPADADPQPRRDLPPRGSRGPQSDDVCSVHGQTEADLTSCPSSSHSEDRPSHAPR